MKRLLIAAFLGCSFHQASAQTQTSTGLTITPAKVAFGRQALNSTASPVTIIVTNRTSSPIAIEEIIASGIDFPSRNNCDKQLAAGAQCSVEVTFRPVIIGDRTGILEITASDSANSHFVPLIGVGVNQ